MADYLSDEEQVAALRKWWEENGTFLIIAVLVVAGGVFSWRWYQDYSRTREEAASKVYEEYLELRAGLAESDDAAKRQAQLLDQLDEDYADTSYETFTLFYRASDALAKEDVEQAEGFLRRALEQAPTEELVDLSRTRLARVLEQGGNADAALTLLAQVTSPGYVSIAAELKGDILKARGDISQARSAYEVAVASINENDNRPILKMKLANLATLNESNP